ncbi:Cardiolipin synthetase [hydrothermal vent metagenome]|uniref:Cardiolipin synthetase n=1 Tax=hydrothermal vent metagenome TaxID=652676 RepID=A0A1W1EE67_9ZZZZ
MKKIHIFIIMISLLILTACSSLPNVYPRTTSYALTSYKSTNIGKVLEKEVALHNGKSGFDVIRYGREAFTARIAMTDLTEKTLDLQYYIWDSDETGRLLALHTLQVADRGVKVRVLLDDIGLESHDKMIAALDAHPNIDIRIFNPFSNRNWHIFDMLSDTERVNHRMHNKTVIMDNAFAIVGGRNIGNHYFGVSDESNFRDMDIAAVGPIVRDVSKMYDYFWNGKWSVPISVITKKKYTMKDLEKERKKLEKKIKKDRYPYPLAKDSKKLQSNLKKLMEDFVWTSKGRVLWNDPAQMRLERDKQTHTIISSLHKRVNKVNKTLLMESAYFIPREYGIEHLKKLRKKGVKVRILTNSLKSNDVLAAYAGYNNYRVELLKIGVEVYELRADAGKSKLINHTLTDSNKKVSTALHAKIFVFDDKDLFVGSYNLDPRSSKINTEGGIYIPSPVLAKRVISFMDEGINLKNAYRLNLDKSGHITWTTIENGKKVVYTSEPKTSVWDKMKVSFLQILPLEDQL